MTRTANTGWVHPGDRIRPLAVSTAAASLSHGAARVGEQLLQSDLGLTRAVPRPEPTRPRPHGRVRRWAAARPPAPVRAAAHPMAGPERGRSWS